MEMIFASVSGDGYPTLPTFFEPRHDCKTTGDASVKPYPWKNEAFGAFSKNFSASLLPNGAEKKHENYFIGNFQIICNNLPAPDITYLIDCVCFCVTLSKFVKNRTKKKCDYINFTHYTEILIIITY